MKGYTDYKRAKNAKYLGKKGEENIYGAGVKKGEEIEMKKLNKESLKNLIREIVKQSIEEATYAGPGGVADMKKDPDYNKLSAMAKTDAEAKLKKGDSVSLEESVINKFKKIAGI